MRGKTPAKAGLMALVLLVGIVAQHAAQVAAACAARAERRPMIAGAWKEYWGIPGETDVTYHDEYRIALRKDGVVMVEILNRDHRIERVAYQNGRLTFVLQTTFAVEYDLALDPDDGWLKGTATTPEKTVPIKWERTR
jgi:hypothetical protein